MLKRCALLVLVPLVFAACADLTDVGQEPNIRVVDGANPLGDPELDPFASESFFFRSPIVPEPQEFSGAFNPYFQTTVEIWSLGTWVEDAQGNPSYVMLHRDSVYAYGDDDEVWGTPYGCTSGSDDPSVPQQPGRATLRNSYSGSDISVDAINEKYELGWNTDDDLTQDDLGYVFRVCVRVTDPFADPEDNQILLGYRDVSPDASGADIPRDGDELPIYQFNLGRNLPIKYWIGGGALCFDADDKVIDCTTVTLGANGGTATCNDAQCGIYVPQGLIQEGQTATFEVRYVECTDYHADNTVDYLDIDIPQYFGCLEVKTVADYVWSGYGGDLSPGITIASCRDEEILGPQDERLLLHIESSTKDNGRNQVYALPTRPFDLNCDEQPLAPGASWAQKARYHLARGARAVQRTLLPFLDPPALTAAHAGFGGGTSLSCGDAAAGADGPNAVSGCSAPSLVSGGGAPALTEVLAGDVVTYRAVWALPSKIAERLRVDELGNLIEPPAGGTWVDPVSVAVGGNLYPAVRVTDECVAESGQVQDQYGNIITIDEPCYEVVDGVEIPWEPQNVAGATVTFLEEDGTLIGTGITGTSGIAWPGSPGTPIPWTITQGGTFFATASGLGVGVDQSLNLVTLPTGSAVGAYQDHIGNTAVLLRTPKLRFEASACSDKSEVLNTRYVDGAYGAGIPIPINVSSSDADTAYLYVTNDCYNVYFALEVPESQDLQNALRVVFVDRLESRFIGLFDPMDPRQFSAVPAVGDDMWFIARDADKKSPTHGQWLIDDWHVSGDCTGSSKQSECGRSDPVQNLLAREPGGAVYTPIDDLTATVYEFARCFPGADNPECAVDPNGYDFYVPDVGGSTWVGFYLVLQGGNGAQGNTEYPDFRVFQPFEIVRQ